MRLLKFLGMLSVSATEECIPGLSNTVGGDGLPLPDGQELVMYYNVQGKSLKKCSICLCKKTNHYCHLVLTVKDRRVLPAYYGSVCIELQCRRSIYANAIFYYSK